MVALRLVVVAVALAGAIACDSGNRMDYADTDGSELDTANGEIDSDDTDIADAPADFWSVDGRLSIVGGSVDVASSTLTFSSYAEGAVTCCSLVFEGAPA